MHKAYLYQNNSWHAILPDELAGNLVRQNSEILYGSQHFHRLRAIPLKMGRGRGVFIIVKVGITISEN